jgi:hypothetical protein
MEDVNIIDDCAKQKCPKCKAKCVWWNLVDITNGSYEDNERIDGYIELKVKKQTKCDKCNSILETIYKIPRKRGGKYENK